MGGPDEIFGTLGGSPISLHTIKSHFSLFLTVVKPKCFANLNPKLKFQSWNVKWFDW
jgi:hypothetical protein